MRQLKRLIYNSSLRTKQQFINIASNNYRRLTAIVVRYVFRMCFIEASRTLSDLVKQRGCHMSWNLWEQVGVIAYLMHQRLRHFPAGQNKYKNKINKKYFFV